MPDTARKQAAATNTVDARELRRKNRRDRQQKIAIAAFFVVFSAAALWSMARAGLLSERVEAPVEEDPVEHTTLYVPGYEPERPGDGGLGMRLSNGAPGQAILELQPGVKIVHERAPLEKALQAKGLYLTMDSVGTSSNMEYIRRFVRDHPGLNCVVIDVKDNSGRVPTNPPHGIPGINARYDEFPEIVDDLKSQGLYMIARIVAFQDPHLAGTFPEKAIRNADGSLWRDRDGRLWLNPYDKENWVHLKDISMWAVDMGFDEIQFDYVRFPDSAQGLEHTGTVLMPGSSEYENRGEAIAEFLKYMDFVLGERAYLAADVFGFVTIAVDDMGIGQKLEELADCVDFICPMVYPSHYFNPGIYGFEVPEAHPYEVVYRAMDEAISRTEGLRSKIRPWLQDFSLRVHYGLEEVQGQINATREHDIDTYMLWNPANVYTSGTNHEQ